MADDPNFGAELKTIAAGLKTATDEVKTFAEKVQTEMKNLGAATEETKANADKALTAMNELGARMTELEQKSARRGGGDVVELKTLGQVAIESEDIKALLKSGSQWRGNARVSVDLKTITSAATSVGSGASASTSLVVADRQAQIIGQPLRKLVVRDLITPGQTGSSNIEYVQETDNPTATAASVVSEGQLKPESDIKFDLKSAPVRTIAHFMKASRQIMDDAPQLQSYIDGRLRYGLGYVEEAELLYGDGTGQHLLGIVPQATAYAGAFAPSLSQQIDVLRLAALQATLALYPASGYVLHPTDWAKIETLKDTLGRYIVGDPTGQLTAALWGLPVVETPAMVAGNFLTGAFRLGAQIFDRMSIEVLISTENDTDFVRNLITIRGEERLSLVVYRPKAFTYGSLG